MDYWNEDTQQAHNKLTEKYGRDFKTQKKNCEVKSEKVKCKAGQDTQGKEYKVKQEIMNEK